MELSFFVEMTKKELTSENTSAIISKLSLMRRH